MDKYSFVQKLGQGSFAVVWKARRRSDGRHVAVKHLRQSPKTWDECKKLAEVRSAAMIGNHRYVVHLLEAVRHAGELFLVFEFCNGSLFHCNTQEQRHFGEPHVRWAARRLLSALAAVHAAGLVHCDVKPENILIADDGNSGPTLKLCDFGQATAPELVGTYVGTRWYRSPELILGARGGTGLDLWAAGCTFAELFLRRPLFPGSDVRDMLWRICGELGPPDPNWPLARRAVEVSGRSHGSAAIWAALGQVGASETSTALIGALLRYDSTQRWSAPRSLNERFFSPGFEERPIPPPKQRPASAETMRRQREEAVNLERKIFGPSGMDPTTGQAQGASHGLTPNASEPSLGLQSQGLRRDWSHGQLPGFSFRPIGPPVAVLSGMVPPPQRHAEAIDKEKSPIQGLKIPQYPSGSIAEKAPTISPQAKAVSSSAKPSTNASGIHNKSSSPRPPHKTGTNAGSDSDDEALAEMFGNFCKEESKSASQFRFLESPDVDDVSASAASSSRKGNKRSDCYAGVHSQVPRAGEKPQRLPAPERSEERMRFPSGAAGNSSDEEDEKRIASLEQSFDDEALAEEFWTQVTGAPHANGHALEVEIAEMERALGLVGSEPPTREGADDLEQHLEFQGADDLEQQLGLAAHPADMEQYSPDDLLDTISGGDLSDAEGNVDEKWLISDDDLPPLA